MMKIHVFFDRRSFLSLLCLCFTVGVAWAILADGEIGWGVFFAFLSLIPCFAILVFPCFYLMTDKGIRIFYFFFLSNEYYLWANVEEVAVVYSTGYKSLPYVFDTFSITGKPKGKKRFYKKGEIIRTRRAKRLIEKYTGKKITGFLMDDIKSDLKNQRQEATRMKAHRTRMKQARIAQREKAKRKEMKNKQKGNRHE